MSTFVVRWCDVVIIDAYRTIGEVGQYAVAYQGYMALYGFMVVAVSVLTPRITSLRLAERTELVHRYVERVLAQGVLLSAIAIGLGVPAVHALIPIVLGDEFAASADPLALLLLSLQSVMVISYSVPVLLAYHRNRALGLAGAVGATLNIALDLVLVPGMGITGAAVATVIAQAALAGLIVLESARSVGASQPAWAVASLPAVVGVLAVLLVPSDARYAIAPLAAAIVGVVLIRFTSIVRPDDTELLAAIDLPGPIRRALVRLVGWAG